MIGELNTDTNKVRRWNIGSTRSRLPDRGSWTSTTTGSSGSEPRADSSCDWTPTATPNNVHVIEVPFSFANNVVSIDADAAIGYTTFGEDKVGMFSPDLSAWRSRSRPSVPVTITPSASTTTCPPRRRPPITQFTGAACAFPRRHSRKR